MSSEKTPNLNMHKWVPKDPVKRDELVENFLKIDEAHKQVNEQLAHKVNLDELEAKQDWNVVYDSLRVANDVNILYKKTDDNNIDIYVNHFNNYYQKWNFTRNAGFDNAVTSHANGNAWQIDQVRNVNLGSTVQKDIDSPTLVKTGTWTAANGRLNSSVAGDYLEETVFGTDIYLDYLAINSGGVVEVYVDSVLMKTIDTYDVSSGTNKKVLIASGLNNINHTVKIVIKAEKNEASSSTRFFYRYLITNSKVNFDDTRYLVETVENMPSGTSLFRYGQSAIEIALLTTLNGITVWGGTYHKYLRPATANNQQVYIDGVLKSLSTLATQSYLSAKDITISQDLVLMNGTTDIANVTLFHHFTSKGCHIKWKLTWLTSPLVVRSFNAMFGTSVDKVILGDTQTPITAVKDNAEKGNSFTDNMIGWHTTDNYIVSLKGLNYSKMKTNYSKGMYVADRTTDFKLYFPKFFNVTPNIGDVWVSEFIVGISKIVNSSNIA